MGIGAVASIPACTLASTRPAPPRKCSACSQTHSPRLEEIPFAASGRIPSVDSQNSTGDVAAALAQKIFHHGGHIVCLRKTKECTAASDTMPLFGAEIVRQFGIDKAGGDRIHRDTELADLPCQRTGEAGCGSLGRGIDREAFVAVGSDDRGHIDDATAGTIGHHMAYDI